MARRAGQTETDHAAWAAYANLVVPLPGRLRPVIAVSSPPGAPASVAARPVPLGAPRAPTPRVSVGTHPPGVDAASWQRFRTGRLRAVRRLDLHGRTAQRAFVELSHFLRVAHADRVRCVEVITGRGGPEGGVLRRELPLWLNLPELRPLVLAAAHPHPGNDGAVRLLLRRVRG
ncbi:MAG: Smr/MutS family protein [Acetobacteraceae bacterium]